MSMFRKIMRLFGYVRHDLLENEIVAENKTLKRQKVLLEFKNQLITNLLKDDSNKNESLAQFHTLLYKDFYDFANKENSLANEAEAFYILQSIEKELEIVTIYPELYKKAIIGVGGAFSAGKSAFISSFMDNDSVKLPIDTTPTTAIPTFVMPDSSTKLNAFSQDGVRVNLSELDSEIHSKINHEFIESFGFNLKKIMPFMVLQTPLCYEHLCFVDTPGHNAPTSNFADDKQTAMEFLENINALIWLVDISNGTIPSDDIVFLSKLGLDNKKLYILLNKADLQSSDDISGIIESVKDTLDDNDIEYEGISAYSAKQKRELDFEGIKLQDFLEFIKVEHRLHENLVKRLFEVYEMYAKAMLSKQANKKAIYKALHSLSLDLAEKKIGDKDKARQRLTKIQKIFKSNDESELFETLKRIVIDMQNAIDEIFGKPLKINLPQIDEKDIKVEFDLAVEEIIDEESKKIDKIQNPPIKKKQKANSQGNKQTEKQNLSKEYKLKAILKDAFNGLYGEMQDDDKTIQQLAKAFNELYEAKISNTDKSKQKEQQ